MRVSTVVTTEDGDGGVRVDCPALELELEPGAELEGRLDVGLAGPEEPGVVELDSAQLVLGGAAGVVRVRV